MSGLFEQEKIQFTAELGSYGGWTSVVFGWALNHRCTVASYAGWQVATDALNIPDGFAPAFQNINMKKNHPWHAIFVNDSPTDPYIIDVKNEYKEIRISFYGKHSVSEFILDAFKAANPQVVDEPDVVTVGFCSASQEDEENIRRRRIKVAKWNEISQNYPVSVRDPFDKMIKDFDGTQKMIIFRGPPGTGKTWAIRSIISEWREKADFLYITDPDRFFNAQTGYMLSTLYSDSAEAKSKVLILEDCGEFITLDSKNNNGQALSRLLNAADGILGQGVNLKLMISTNEDIDKFCPAVTRPGRCNVNLEFPEFDHIEASEWLEKKNMPKTLDKQKTYSLSELYAMVEGYDVPEKQKKALGFNG